MQNQWIVLAQYDNFLQANQDAQTLKSEGIPCIIESVNPLAADALHKDRMGEILLKVPSIDKELAALSLDLNDPWFEKPTRQQLSQQYMLVGMITAIIGLFSTIGSFTGFVGIWRWIPFALLIMGGILFWKGMVFGKRENARAKGKGAS